MGSSAGVGITVGAATETGDSERAIFLRSTTGDGDRLPDWLLLTMRLPLVPALAPELPPEPPPPLPLPPPPPPPRRLSYP